MLLQRYSSSGIFEAGADEAGRGCLAGPVFAAAVILPPGFEGKDLNDSKQLTEKQRNKLRIQIEAEALSWSVAMVSPEEIDKINILNASILAMHKAIVLLTLKPELLLIDGNRFTPYPDTEHKCIIRGDGIYMSIAAASVLAKTHRDEFMMKLHEEFPVYGWNKNKGYPTLMHRRAIFSNGQTIWHRKTFKVSEQLKINF
ncbi:MAG: ribonuclease HII [Bacteroidota bacterium]